MINKAAAIFCSIYWSLEKQPHHYFPPNYTNNSEILNVLHLSDVHIQLRYQLETESNCTSDPCAVPESYNEELPGKDYNFTDYYRHFNPDLTEIGRASCRERV